MKWVSTFSYLPVNYGFLLATVENQTQRLTFDNNLNGNRIRIRFSNRYSEKPLTLQRVSVGIVRDGAVQNVCMVSRNGNSVIELKPGEECWSDETEYAVAAGDRIAVSTYVKEPQEIRSVSLFWSKTGPKVRLGRDGDYVSGGRFEECPAEEVYQFVREDANKGQVFYGFTGLQVLTDDKVKTIAAFGDSITHMSYVTNALYKRLYAAYPGQVALVNRGIGGNRVLHDATRVDFIPGNGCCFGDAGVKRFEKDVFGQEPADVVLVLEGINDIMHPIQFSRLEEQVTPEELLAGYGEYIQTAHRHQVAIFGATIPPCGNEEYPEEWLAAFESVRLEVNRRIREGMDFDGYFDYDEAVRDDLRSGYMRKEYHIGDGLHPNDEGGAAMAEAVYLDEVMGK
ncbi:MAG: GDSL-type esterase/lipase family protein [Eubacteriales bacterium]|nr:GDSL-type esterase/lipase family protein [Eubacteriales bacterium]